MIGIKKNTKPYNPLAHIPTEIADQFTRIVTERYGNDFEAEIKGFKTCMEKRYRKTKL